MSFPFRSPFVLVLLFLPVIALLTGVAQAAPTPGSILPQEGPVYDDLVNQTPPPPPMQGGREGYVGTHVDPATGDIITDIISPRMPQQQQQQMPIYIQPRVDVYDPYIPPNMQQGGQPGMRPGPHPGGYPGGHWKQGSHRMQHPNGKQGRGDQPHGYGLTHPGQAQPGLSMGAMGGMGQHGMPHVSGNSVQHPGYTLPGGNPGNMGQYMPQGHR